MQKLYKMILELLEGKQTSRDKEIKGSTFFDYSSAEKIKILRAAGRQAQKEQQKLLKSYDSRFGRL